MTEFYKIVVFTNYWKSQQSKNSRTVYLFFIVYRCRSKVIALKCRKTCVSDYIKEFKVIRANVREIGLIGAIIIKFGNKHYYIVYVQAH